MFHSFSALSSAIDSELSIAPAPLNIPDAAIHNTSTLRKETLTSIAVARPRSAISIGHPRPDPSKRATSRLKECNAVFLALCDVVRFQNSACESVFVMSPLFLPL